MRKRVLPGHFSIMLQPSFISRLAANILPGKLLDEVKSPDCWHANIGNKTLFSCLTKYLGNFEDKTVTEYFLKRIFTEGVLVNKK